MSDIDQSRKDAVASVNAAIRASASFSADGKKAEAATAQAAAIVYLADVLREAFVK